MTAQMPIFDLDAERDLLATVLGFDGAYDEAAEILRSADDLYNAEFRGLWMAIGTANTRFGRVDLEGLITVLKDSLPGEKYLAAVAAARAVFADGAVILPVARLADRVRDLARLRAVRELGHQITSGASEHTRDAQEWIDSVEQSIFDLAHVAEHRETMSDAKTAIIELVRAKKTAMEAGTAVGTPTGLDDLDKLTHGLHDGQLIVLAGAPSMGKTALASCIAINVAALDRPKRGVAFFSLEMSTEECIERMAVSEARLNLSKVRGLDFAHGEWEAFVQASSLVSQLALVIDEKAAATPGQIRARARRAASRFKRTGVELALIVVDYVQLMTSSGNKNESREQQVSTCSRALKALAKEMHVPVIALAQVNRAIEKNEGSRPNMSNLRESGALEQDADMVLFAHREAYYRKDDRSLDGLAEIIVAKQRSGPRNRTVDVAFLEESTRFDNLDGEKKRRAIAARQSTAAPKPRSRRWEGKHAS